jgi:RsiW-degrading membrane proteinase PrsW (M82 family)
MTVILFEIILDGSLKEGHDPKASHENLAKLLRVPTEKLANMLIGKPIVIKRGVDSATAEKYKTAIESTGACCFISPIIVQTTHTDQAVSTIKERTNQNLTTDTLAVVSTPTSSKERADQRYISSIQNASDKITGQLGLEKIEGFSLTAFFSEAFRKHDPDDVERLLSVGTPETTPIPNTAMGVMPNPWIFFRVLSGTVIAYLIFMFAWKEFHNINLVPGLIIIGSFAVPFSVLILFFELNTPKNVSIIKIVQLVVVGGGLSLLLSLILFQITPFLGAFGESAAGFVEEIGKLAALLFVMRTVKSDRYKYRLNALLLGAAVGTGFAAFESAGYALRYGLQSAEMMLEIIQLRGVMSPFAHIVWTSIAASAFWIARPHHSDTWNTVTSPQFLKIFAIPVALHFIWNLPYEGPFMVKFIILGFIAWVVIISFVQSGLREISAASISKG